MLAILSRSDGFLLVAGLLFGLGFAAVTPPFQVADEPAHFYRAYRVSEGRLDLIPRPGRGAADLPASVRDVATSLRGDLPFHPERKMAPGKILAGFRVPLRPERRVPVWLANTLQYPFVPYVPQALGIALGRLLGAPPLGLLYLARLFNLIAGTLMISFAVRRLPALRWLAVMIALTPMALSLRASASADATSVGAAFLLAAAVAKLVWGGDEPGSRIDLGLVVASSAVLCASKVAYLPLAFLAFLIPSSRFTHGKRAGFLLLHTSVSLAVAAFAVMTSRAAGVIRFDAAVDPGRQMRDALAHPLDFLQVVAIDYVVHAPRYLSQLVGKLGWLDTELPQIFIVAYLAALLALVFVDGDPQIEVRPWQRWAVAGLTLCTMVLISASQYAVWTPYGADFIQGLQGRYFIPLAPAAAWALHSRKLAGRIPPRFLGTGLAAFSLVSFGISLWTLVERFFLLHQ
jgi:predicted membrane protein DUF2142